MFKKRGIEKKLVELEGRLNLLVEAQKSLNNQDTMVAILRKLLERQELTIDKLTEKLMARDYKELKTYEDPHEDRCTTFSLPSADELETFAGESIPQELLDGKDS